MQILLKRKGNSGRNYQSKSKSCAASQGVSVDLNCNNTLINIYAIVYAVTGEVIQ